jgi:hypothetical protein
MLASRALETVIGTFLSGLLLVGVGTAHAKEPTTNATRADKTTPAKSPDTSPAADKAAAKNGSPMGSGGSTNVATTAPAVRRGANPFWRLKPTVERDKLPPLSTVRVRRAATQDGKSRSKRIRVVIKSSPSASVSWGGKSLGSTPLVLSAPRNSTPLDIVLRRKGFMPIRTRVQRLISRTYFFKLHPAKFR